MDATSRFTALRSFYKEQIASASASESGLPTAALDLYSSPSSLARIMNLLGNPGARSVSDLRPIPAALRTKRSKRCATCSHILVRPEFKPTSTRYRIRLLALNYIPFVTLRPMPGSAGKASQWILTMRNPLYEKVNVTLGAEALTPGPHRHRVTILCPEFEVGKSGDVWDDALDLGNKSSAAAATAGAGIAGKVYDKGRNWVSVVVEIVPGLIERRVKRDEDGDEEDEEDEDEDVVEVPIRVRLEWRQTENEGEGDDEDEAVLRDDGRREVAYWMVLGVARVKTYGE
ncbi:hypothetical protein DV735_g385, partial [Chaetothyriales sp. CBS 134920]